jgi:deoxyribodipyrimidine photo-lyase
LAPTVAPTLFELGLPALSAPLPKGGERAAWATLESFLDGRGRDYRRALSSPLTAAEGCSRLSAHLAFGTISMRCVHQATEARIAATPDPRLVYALRGFASRLRWHCHFMQKLEDEPAIEWRNVARSVDGLRPGDGVHASPVNLAHLQAWCEGRTGYPMVDACMRSLIRTGWLNFRMRAMLVSFASYHLWLHWRPTGLFLARQFLDYEPGIHWSQMQMQSGTTGINTLRMYSPTKQAKDQDPEGLFIRRWVPELARVPLPYLAEPWTMAPSVQHMAGCVIGIDYPAPIVDDKSAMKRAKDRMYGLRQSLQAREEAGNVLARHGSRKSGLPPTGQGRPAKPKKATSTPVAPSPQGDLFA